MQSVVFREISHEWGDFSNSKYERRHVYVNPEIYDSGKKKRLFLSTYMMIFELKRLRFLKLCVSFFLCRLRADLCYPAYASFMGGYATMSTLKFYARAT